MSTIWDQAKQMELEGKVFYEKAAEESPISQTKAVFELLAEEEQTHYSLFDSFSKAEAVELKDSVIGRSIKEAFQELAPDAVGDVSSAGEAYEKALELEKNAVAFYTDGLGSCANDAEKKALEQIITEEKKHVQICESLIEFVSRPGEWLENAEFNHLDDY